MQCLGLILLLIHLMLIGTSVNRIMMIYLFAIKLIILTEIGDRREHIGTAILIWFFILFRLSII